MRPWTRILRPMCPEISAGTLVLSHIGISLWDTALGPIFEMSRVSHPNQNEIHIRRPDMAILAAKIVFTLSMESTVMMDMVVNVQMSRRLSACLTVDVNVPRNPGRLTLSLTSFSTRKRADATRKLQGAGTVSCNKL